MLIRKRQVNGDIYTVFVDWKMKHSKDADFAPQNILVCIWFIPTKILAVIFVDIERLVLKFIWKNKVSIIGKTF